jgi:hypothetical protein
MQRLNGTRHPHRVVLGLLSRPGTEKRN